MADNVANNLANVDTTGFKQTLLQIQSAPTLDIYRIQTDPGKAAGNPLPGKPVAQNVGPARYRLVGVRHADELRTRAAGADRQPAAISRSPARPTRSFRCKRPTAYATRATASSHPTRKVCSVTHDGDAILSTNGQQLQIQNQGGPVTIASNGTVLQNGQQVPDRSRSRSSTACSTCVPKVPTISRSPATPDLRKPRPPRCSKAFSRRATATSYSRWCNLINAERWFEANEKSMKTQDDATNTAISAVAKTSLTARSYVTT